MIEVVQPPYSGNFIINGARFTARTPACFGWAAGEVAPEVLDGVQRAGEVAEHQSFFLWCVEGVGVVTDTEVVAGTERVGVVVVVATVGRVTSASLIHTRMVLAVNSNSAVSSVEKMIAR